MQPVTPCIIAVKDCTWHTTAVRNTIPYILCICHTCKYVCTHTALHTHGMMRIQHRACAHVMCAHAHPPTPPDLPTPHALTHPHTPTNLLMAVPPSSSSQVPAFLHNRPLQWQHHSTLSECPVLHSSASAPAR